LQPGSRSTASNPASSAAWKLRWADRVEIRNPLAIAFRHLFHVGTVALDGLADHGNSEPFGDGTPVRDFGLPKIGTFEYGVST
jgi:hypothetical protein